MAVILPQTSGNIVPEYAATNINFNRSVQNIEGVLVPVYSASINYERKDYLVDSAGKKVGVISLDIPIGAPSTLDNLKIGTVSLLPEQVNVLFAQIPETGKVLGEIIADMADSLIHDDLVARGIISA